jgi:hypothetical protein
MKVNGLRISSKVKAKKTVLSLLFKITPSGADGSYYEGDYVEGRKEGKGKYVWPEGSYYYGDWKGNKINGYVKVLFS